MDLNKPKHSLLTLLLYQTLCIFSHSGLTDALAYSTREVFPMKKKNILIYVLLAFALSITLTILSRVSDEGGVSPEGTSASEISWLRMNNQP